MRALVLCVVLATLVLCVVLATACTKVERGPGGGGSAWPEYCNTTGPERAMRCDELWAAADTTECNQQGTCIQPFVRADLFADIPACLAGRECGTSDDFCFSAEGLGASESTAAAAYRTACMNRRGECSDAGASFSDDFCFVSIVTDAVVSDLMECLASPCAEVRACFDSVLPNC